MQIDQPPAFGLEAVAPYALPDVRLSSSTLDLDQHCQGFLSLIVEYLSLSTAWILRGDVEGQLQIVSVAGHPGGIDGFSSEPFPYYNDAIPQFFEDQVARLDQPGLQHWVDQKWQIYGRRLHQQLGQYVLFLTDNRLSAPQWQWVEHQILLVSDYIDLHQAFSQQQAQLLAEQQHLHQTAHQVGTPLSLIALYTDMLQTKTKEGAGQEYLVPLQQAVKQLNLHLQDLIDRDCEEVLSVEGCDLQDLIAENVQVLNPWLQEREVSIHYPQASIKVWVDRWQMRQVFDNLLSNAMHFSPKGSQISVTWQLFQAEVLIEVRDQGPGLSAEDLCCVFSPYYSRRHRGKGLGLAIAQQIVCRHRGRLWASNLPDGGAQFSISLPRQFKA